MTTRIVIAHRGASAYAPENTLPSYDLAILQGADCIELDLHPSRDNVLVCIHDATLERTTNVGDVFPDRKHETLEDGAVVHRWRVHDFSLAELKRLHSGTSGGRILTLDEVLDWALGRTSLLAELKHPEAYEPMGVDLLSLFDRVVRRRGLPSVRSSDTPLTVQSFHEPTVRRAGALYQRRLPAVLLQQPAEAEKCASQDRFAAIAGFADGIGPEKSSLDRRPHLVVRAHQAGLCVTPWTFRASSPGRFGSVRAEMAYYLSELDVDAVITDNPDQAVEVLRSRSFERRHRP
jgi:glycerophosphoryl diester phosphodiesterase